MDHQNQPPSRGGRPVTGKDVAHANAFFEEFLNAATLKNILGYYRSICDLLNLKPNLFPLFYPKLRGYLTSWKAKALWKKFDARALHKCYGKGKLCSGSRVLIIGAGPCGLRTAIEAQLLGAKVVVIEKRDRLSRNNVLHLWPFVIEDLRSLGAKKFFGKFCAGAIDHISIRQLQCILLKVVLLLGVEVHTEVSFERLVEPDPSGKTGWRAEFEPASHPVSQYEFDVVIGADGKRNTLQGFKRKEFRGKLAIAITANFINKRTEAEARVEEISGVAFIFNQKFFKELHEATGIDLENIVYYKDDTHYFVMTAKKASLIEKGVIKRDLADTERLLAPDNVNRDALMDYAREAANFSTNYQMPDVEFAVNHYGQPDVAMFDFTSMYAAENASKVVERAGYRLLMVLVGDSLLEPFWPTGSGCARGFLSSLDAAWAIRSWCSGSMNPLDVIAERESIYRLLGQTTPDNLNKDWKAYTLDPVTRYPNLNKNVVMPHQTSGLFDSDNPNSLERMRRHSEDVVAVEAPKKRRRGNVDNEVLLGWISEQVREHSDVSVTDLASVFRDGKALCAVIGRYRPDLLDYVAVKDEEPAKMNQLALDVLEREIGISPIMTGEEITDTEDYLSMATYLTQVYDCFRCEIPHIKHPKLVSGKWGNPQVKIAVPKPPPPPPIFVPSLTEVRTCGDGETVKPGCTSLSASIITSSLNASGSGDHRSEKQVKISLTASGRLGTIKYAPRSNLLRIIRRKSRVLGASRRVSRKNVLKFSYSRANMSDSDGNTTAETEQVFTRVSNWISSHDFRPHDDHGVETNLVDGITDITSVTKNLERDKAAHDGLVVEERTDEVKCGEAPQEKDDALIKTLSRFSQYSPFEKRRTRTASPTHFSVIVEGEELELPESKKSEGSFKSVKHYQQQVQQITQPPPRPSSRHKRHADPLVFPKSNQLDRKTRKRRTLEKIGASVDHENKLPNQTRGNTDEDFAARIKSLEDKWKEPQPVEKKPKDLLRAIGKIETSDWNIKEIEKKIRENKQGKPGGKDKEKVPKWSKETFIARQSKMEKQHLDRQDSAEAKFADIDKNIKHLELKLKEGNSRDLGQNKVATITEKLASKAPEEPKPIQKSNSRPVILPSQKASEFCHFCGKRVYLMERLSAEGRFFHHGCFKCQYCHTQLRLGSYAFDKDGIYDHKFFCIHHYGMQGEIRPAKVSRRPSQRQPEKKPLSGIAGVDLLDRVRTPERVEFANLSVANASDHEESLSQMDEDEWTDKNFGASAAELGSSEDESSSLSDSDSDDEDAFEEALEEPATKEGTLKWAERFNRRYSKKRDDSDSDGYSSSDQSSYYENTSDDDDSETATEGEEEIRARELRKQEVRVEPPVVQTDTGTDTEVVSDESTSDSSSEVRNSATEISTDSEFAHDDPTPTRELPSTTFNDANVTKRRGGRGIPRKIQVTTGYLQRPHAPPKPDIELNLSPLVPSAPSIVRKAAPLRGEGYALNRTQSTGGIAAKVSLELKKKYLLGESPSFGSIQKSGSASTLDTKLKSFHNNITDCQKLLKPALQPPPNKPPPVFNPEPEGRPRSPVHETSIIVPTIDWSKKNDITEDSLSSDSAKTPEFNFDSIPTVRIDEIPPDSLCGEPPKDPKTLNQPKQLPELEPSVLPEIHDAHVKRKLSIEAESDTAALTETELSDWARDGPVSDDDFGLDLEAADRSARKPKTVESKARIAEFEDIDHVCGKEEVKDKTIITEALNSVLSKNLDIEFMDTGTETSSDDGVVDSQNGYVLFKDEDDFPEDSLDQEVVEARNEIVKNTGYCVIATDNFGGEVIELKPSDLEKLKNKNTGEHEEDSLLIVETGTTTEENTCSDSTVKNLTEIDNNNFQRKRLKEKLARLKAEAAKNSSQSNENVEFEEHCQRLQSRIEFGNVKDSIDVRKSRRKSGDSPQKPDLIREEKPVAQVVYKREAIEKERDVNQKLVQEMVMNKMKQENKSLERKRRKSRNFELTKSFSELNTNNLDATPDVLLSTLKQTPESERFATPLPEDEPSLPDFFKTPVAPPRLKHEEAKRTAEKLKEDARQRARLLSNEELGLSPEDKLVKLKEKLGKGEKQESFLHDYKRSQSGEETPSRTKSSGEIAGSVRALEKFCRSDPNLLDTDPKKGKKKGSNARERRKSITKLITTFFTKKSPGNSKGIFSRISPKTKDVSKSCANLDLRDPEIVIEEPIRRKSFSEVSSHRSIIENNSPPPVPPLPLNYSKDDSSDGEHERRSSCDTLDQSGALDSSVANNKTSKSARRLARQAQLKRHRMAQEIQRKLEETEVKTRELEERGVSVEKALRGEDSPRYSKEEPELLQEWFDLMRDRTELRRYERELMVRAQELELEDRHARLQHELRERLDNNEKKTEEEVAVEGSIINEMMEIVAKRDSLIALLEEDRLRYSNEDRDFEEQMLAKGLRLTPIRKTPEK